MKGQEIPLFPLNVVLFPGGPLPLRIFETRYLDMVRRCMRGDARFGVLLIREGAETGPASVYDVGTTAKIVDWNQTPEGMLGIMAVGEKRFSLRSRRVQKDGLNVGIVDHLEPERVIPLPDRYRALVRLLIDFLDQLGTQHEGLEHQLDDASWVSCRLAEILPLPLPDKQRCLETGDPILRLDILRAAIAELREES